MIVSTTCSEVNSMLIKRILEKGLINLCPYTVGFVDACLLADDYFLLISYFGDNLALEVLSYLEEEERYEECALLKKTMDELNSEDYFI
jgi:hypothetical protein